MVGAEVFFKFTLSQDFRDFFGGNMKIQCKGTQSLSNKIKLFDSGWNITIVSLNDLGPCKLERYMLGVRLPQDATLGDDAISRFMVSRMAQSGIVFKLAE
jgi:hypothetical protein